MSCMKNSSAAVVARPEARETVQSHFFKMGAVVALGELLNEGELVQSETQRRHLKRYLASFGVNGMEDVERLGVRGIYKYSFEHLYR